MKKIRLDLDGLEVRSFATDVAGTPRGTVRARESYTYGGEDSCDQACIPITYEYATCGQTGPTCGASCDFACDGTSHVCPSDTGGCG
jgi:hypothetical protein